MKERDLDNFLNELRQSADSKFSSRKHNDELLEHEYVLRYPDILNRVERLYIEIEDQKKLSQDVDERLQTFSEHLSELTNIVTESPAQMAKEVTQKVEHFLTYHTQQVNDRIRAQEQKLDVERKKMMEEFHRQQAVLKRNMEQYGSPVGAPPPPSGSLTETLQLITLLKQEMRADRPESSTATDQRLQRLEEKLDAWKPRVPVEGYNSGKTQTSSWIYIGNIVVLIGILFFLLHHFLSNYTVKVEPELQSSLSVPEQTSETKPLIPELLPIPKTSHKPKLVPNEFFDTVGLINFDQRTVAINREIDSLTTLYSSSGK